MAKTLYVHKEHNHTPRNANEVHKEELESRDWFDRFVDWVIDKTATKIGVIVFLGIGVGAFMGYATGNALMGLLFGALSSCILQLIYLAFLLISQKSTDRKQRILADEMYKMTVSIYHNEIEQTKHMQAQDTEIIHIASLQSIIMQKMDIAKNGMMDLVVSPQTNQITFHMGSKIFHGEEHA